MAGSEPRSPRGPSAGASSLGSWAASGAMHLTGLPEGPPLAPAAPVARRLERLAASLAQASSALGRRVELDWGSAVAGRAALLGLSRQGRISASGSCQLLRSCDGWVALNLPRPSDLDLARAMLAARGAPAPPRGPLWPALERAATRLEAEVFAAEARLLGLPAAPLWPPELPERRAPRPSPGRRRPLGRRAGLATAGRSPWSLTGLPRPWRLLRLWPTAGRQRPRSLAGLEVVDLSAMWAGPLACAILAAAGAAVTKVESTGRPDGARSWPAFYDWLHPPGQRSIQLDFSEESGREELRYLLANADVVVEASRPRALYQLGAGPEQVPARPGRVWLSITGYGRRAPGCRWVAFGDDAAVAGGLVAHDPSGQPVFCADAIADPLAGMFGALAILECLAAGGGCLVDLSMAAAAAVVASSPKWGRPVPAEGFREASSEGDPGNHSGVGPSPGEELRWAAGGREVTAPRWLPLFRC